VEQRSIRSTESADAKSVPVSCSANARAPQNPPQPDTTPRLLTLGGDRLRRASGRCASVASLNACRHAGILGGRSVRGYGFGLDRRDGSHLTVRPS
jgi:hypothetical protein